MMINPPILLAEVKFDGLLAMRASDRNACVRKAFTAVGLWWLKNRLPRHFTMNAPAEYGYDPLTRRYLTRKRNTEARLGHGMRPLVFTGKLERQVMNPANQRLAVTKSGLTIKLRHDTRRREVHTDLTKLTADEQRQAEMIYRTALMAAIEEFKGRRVVRLTRGGL